MKEYIERNAAIANLEDLPERGELDYLGVFDAIKFTPAADVAPVRHGRWIEHHEQSYLVHPMKYDEYGNPILQDYISYECSECGRKASELYSYCHCGAKMDGGSKNGTV